jgi:DDE family transposase
LLYNDRGECENRIAEFKNGFRADWLSCHRFLANAFRLLLHAAAYNSMMADSETRKIWIVAYAKA